MIPRKSFMQFLAPPSTLSRVFLLTGRRVMWHDYVKSTECNKHSGTETVRYIAGKDVDTEQEMDKCQTERDMWHLFLVNRRVCWQGSLLTLTVTVSIIPLKPPKPIEMFMENWYRLSRTVLRCLWLHSQKTVTGWMLAFHLCYNSLQSVFSPSAAPSLSCAKKESKKTS